MKDNVSGTAHSDRIHDSASKHVTDAQTTPTILHCPRERFMPI